ncbi:MAG: hypothetical protein GYA55_13985, partial [SAR324 cluster bacterium]|nr:hypothetical protein [SAR324 cluster bacterium]
MKTALVLEQRKDSPHLGLNESFPLGKESPSASLLPCRKDIVKAFRQALHPARDAPYISAIEWRLTPDFDIKIRIHCPTKRMATIFEQTALNRRIQARLESIGLRCSFEYTTDIEKRRLARKAAWKELWPKALLGTYSPEEIRDWVGKNIPKGCIHYSVDFADVYTENCQERDLENIVILHTSLPENRRSEFQDFMTKFEQKFKCPIIPVLTEIPFD